MTAITLSPALRKKASYMTPSAMPAARKRRVDIDILRAVAVLSVIFFHFEVPGFSGGFLGVDIFFVISGYLITLHINEGLTRGDFKFANFYLRRIRRLFPAIFITLVLTSVAALLILPKSLLTDFSQSQLAASTYISNIYFWSVADYFDTESIVKPLLHTWSLSVEEQFYMVWPLLIFLIFGQNQLRFIMAFIVISLVAAELTFSHSPSTVFYYFPFRIFEFAIGAMVGQLPPRQLKKLATNGLLLVAGFCVLGSIYLTTEESRNPGLLSLPLCMGVAAIIGLCHPWMNTDNYLTKVLVRVGLVSYSAYLVHWPLLVFYKIYKPGPLSIEATAALIAVTFLLAEILFNCVERPMSKVSIVEHKLKLFLFVPLVFIFALAFKLGEEKLYRELKSDTHSVQAVLDGIPDRKLMLARIGEEIAEKIFHSQVEKTKKIVVIGDSHSVDVTLSLQYLLADTEYAVENKHSICDPLSSSSIKKSLTELYRDHGQDPVKDPAYCERYHQNFLPDLAARSPDIIVFSEAWRGPTLSYISDTVTQVRTLTGADVLLLGKNPIFSPHPNIVFKNVERPEEINKAAWSRRYVHLDQGDGKLAKVALETGSYFVSKLDLICPSEECVMLVDGHMAYVDSNHWSAVGMRYYGARLLETREFQEIISIK